MLFLGDKLVSPPLAETHNVIKCHRRRLSFLTMDVMDKHQSVLPYSIIKTINYRKEPQSQPTFSNDKLLVRWLSLCFSFGQELFHRLWTLAGIL